MAEKIRIAIIEDEVLLAENLKLNLEDLGYEVTDTCYNFDMALSCITAEVADLFMVDINLGLGQENGGLILAENISARKKPFIFLTAYSDSDTICRATKLRPNGYLIKPANPASIFASIQTAIENHQSKQINQDIESPLPHPEYFFVKIGNRNHKLKWANVYCLEVTKNYVKLRMVNVESEIPIRGTLSFVLNELMPESLKNDFLRINRSVSVNKNSISSYSVQRVWCGSECFENTKFTVLELQQILDSRIS